MNSRMTLRSQLQEIDKAIFMATTEKEPCEKHITFLYHLRAQKQDQLDWFMTPWRNNE